ncbi:PREDICTED: E1A-binding protein p400-like [Vollenhovia emeryi]|uniref:E1A-binding protein p400-like n=1 Tax=Vollenhovia emeryi TaxID=411798 RepID=UPI0005F3CD5E|nr:PREDICTED: E1A-binding protein p400-like [Vollenhovia emeryi]
MTLFSGHTPNWDMVADIINYCALLYTSPSECKSRYESVMVKVKDKYNLQTVPPNSQTQDSGDEKLPNSEQQDQRSGSTEMLQLYNRNSNSSFTTKRSQIYEVIRSVRNIRTSTAKPPVANPMMSRPPNAWYLSDFKQLDNPMTPTEADYNIVQTYLLHALENRKFRAIRFIIPVICNRNHDIPEVCLYVKVVLFM